MVPVILNYGRGWTLQHCALLLQEGGLRGAMHLLARYAAQWAVSEGEQGFGSSPVHAKAEGRKRGQLALPVVPGEGALLLGKRGSALPGLSGATPSGDTCPSHAISGGSRWVAGGHWGHCKGSQGQSCALQLEGGWWPPAVGSPPLPFLLWVGTVSPANSVGSLAALSYQSSPAQPTRRGSSAIPHRREASASCPTGRHGLLWPSRPQGR